MSLRLAAVIVFIAAIAALAQVLSTAGGLIASILIGVATGLLMLLPEKVAASAPARWVIPSTLLIASMLGLTAPLFEGRWEFLAGPAAAAGTALLLDVMRLHGASRCALCARRLARQPAFDCPRCGMLVCDRSCWVFEHLRCRLCLQNEVPVFTPDARWWDRQLGPRFHDGQCQLCMTDGAEADLRTCRRCGRPQCRHCWDMNNGECSRCQWTVEELPPALAAYTGPPPAGSRTV